MKIYSFVSLIIISWYRLVMFNSGLLDILCKIVYLSLRLIQPILRHLSISLFAFNQDSWERSDIDPADSGDTGTTPSPGQGQSNGTGGSDGSVKSDLRDDTVSAESILGAMNRDELLNTLQEMARILETEK